ncbi:hypothetical protein TNCV_674171 [Trichonephila clavipes]|uniref:Uncharacterized protein n=1 Tax=Trichonephila clavipes TaxID=2585209 RepID=A0A8X6WCU9_TRICX|nr:hypothetical protein TNCV_674171 [Trichonephila clavipes]
MLEIYKSHGWYFIIVPKVAFPTFVENYVLPCRVETHLEFHGFPLAFFTDVPEVLNVQFERTEAGFFYKQNHSLITPHITENGIVPFEAMPSNLLNHETKKPLEIGDSYLQMKPLRHSPCQDKKIFTSLNELLGEEDWVRELLKNGSDEHFDE